MQACFVIRKKYARNRKVSLKHVQLKANVTMISLVQMVNALVTVLSKIMRFLIINWHAKVASFKNRWNHKLLNAILVRGLLISKGQVINALVLKRAVLTNTKMSNIKLRLSLCNASVALHLKGKPFVPKCIPIVTPQYCNKWRKRCLRIAILRIDWIYMNAFILIWVIKQILNYWMSSICSISKERITHKLEIMTNVCVSTRLSLSIGMQNWIKQWGMNTMGQHIWVRVL